MKPSRLILVGLIVASVVGAFAYAGGWLSPGKLTPKRMIDAFEAANGKHPGFRRNHAKGVGISGYFQSNGRGAALCKASVFRAQRVPVVGRFALAGGMPFAKDTGANVRSMELSFELPGGEQWRTGMNDIPVFPVSTPQAFYEQLLAGTPDPATGKPNPALMPALLTKYPGVGHALSLIKNRVLTSGFADDTYNALNAFRFTNAAGETAFVRWSMVPVEAPTPAPAPAAAPDGPSYLFDELVAAVKRHPAQWRLMVVVAQPGDPTNDASLPWPADRPAIEVGTLTIDHVESEATHPARDLNFDPLILPDGISASDDPLLSARSAAYSVSFTRREGEPKDPSAVTAAETGK